MLSHICICIGHNYIQFTNAKLESIQRNFVMHCFQIAVIITTHQTSLTFPHVFTFCFFMHFFLIKYFYLFFFYFCSVDMIRHNLYFTLLFILFPQPCMKTNEHALVRFRFIKQPEYLREGSRLLLREGSTKGIGHVTKVYAYCHVDR